MDSPTSSVLAKLAPTLEIVSPEEIAKATSLVHTLSTILANASGLTPDPAIENAFQLHVTNVLTKLDSRLKPLQDPNMKKIEASMVK
jgi:hypothetical protein